MQQSIMQKSAITIAPDPTRRLRRFYWIFLGCVLVLWIGAFFLPAPARQALSWSKPSPLFDFHFLGWLELLLGVLFWAIFIWPFLNLPFGWPSGTNTWKSLERRRRQAVQDHSMGKLMERFALPEVSDTLPISISVCLRRNWKATCIAGFVYALFFVVALVLFVSYWQVNMQDLLQQRQLSDWVLIGIVLNSLPLLLVFLPVTTALIFAPRQRLIANQDGLICYRGLSFSYIPWQEACLFAAIDKQGDTVVYELSSAATIIRWSNKPTWYYGDIRPSATIGSAPLGLVRAASSTEEYQRQVNIVTAMVAAATGLPLYDLCPTPRKQKG